MHLDQNIEQNMQTNGHFYHVRFVITLIPYLMEYGIISDL